MAIYDLDTAYLNTLDEVNWTEREHLLLRQSIAFERSIIKAHEVNCPHKFLENEIYTLLESNGIEPTESVTNIYYGQGSDILPNFYGVNADLVIPAVKVPTMLRPYLNLSTMPLEPSLRAAFNSFDDLETYYRMFLRYTKESILLIPHESWERKRYGLPVENKLEYVRDMQSHDYPDVSVKQLFEHSKFEFRFWGVFHHHPAVKSNRPLIEKIEAAATIMEQALGNYFYDFFQYLYTEHSEHLIQKKLTMIESAYQKWAEATCQNIQAAVPVQPPIRTLSNREQHQKNIIKH